MMRNGQVLEVGNVVWFLNSPRIPQSLSQCLVWHPDPLQVDLEDLHHRHLRTKSPFMWDHVINLTHLRRVHSSSYHLFMNVISHPCGKFIAGYKIPAIDVDLM